jgi:hypothetical protein
MMMITKRYDAETGIGKRWGVEKKEIWRTPNRRMQKRGEEKEESCLTNLLGVSVEYLD